MVLSHVARDVAEAVAPKKRYSKTMQSRRTMLKTALAMPALLAAQSPNDTVRVAVIGVGNRGSYLLQNLLKVPGVQIVVLCDIDPERLAAAAKVAPGAAT